MPAAALRGASLTIEIPLNPSARGAVALVDLNDFPLVAPYRWFLDDKGYARARPNYGRWIRMHRLIMGDPPGIEIDHIDGDGLNNVRTNLRRATSTQQKQNCRGRGAQSGFKGVRFDARTGKWTARIGVNHRSHYLGTFVTAEDAARAYDDAAVEHFGEYARLNFEVAP